MSRPSSAISTWAVWTPMPVISSRRATAASGAVAGSSPSPPRVSSTAGCLGGGDLRDQRLDPEGERVDLRREGVDLVEQHPCELGVVVVEAAGQRLDERSALDSHALACELGEQLRVALAGDQRLDHRPPGDAEDVARDARELDQRVLEQLL